MAAGCRAQARPRGVFSGSGRLSRGSGRLGLFLQVHGSGGAVHRRTGGGESGLRNEPQRFFSGTEQKGEALSALRFVMCAARFTLPGGLGENGPGPEFIRPSSLTEQHPACRAPQEKTRASAPHTHSCGGMTALQQHGEWKHVLGVQYMFCKELPCPHPTGSPVYCRFSGLQKIFHFETLVLQLITLYYGDIYIYTHSMCVCVYYIDKSIGFVRGRN